jgi:hypothetical protein
MSRDDDLLARATRKLREDTGGDAPDAGKTRARILLLASRERRRPKRIVWIAPMAAALAASTAWAATQGVAPKVWHQLTVLFVHSPAEQGENGAVPGHGHGAMKRRVENEVRDDAADDAGAPLVPEVAFEALPVAAVPVESLPRDAPPSALASPYALPSAPRPLSASSSSVAAPRSDQEASRLYAVAHEAHFVGHDPGVALAAWDAYLRAAPDGALAPEARYNRALTLVRLGRTDDARAALAPFARGEMGGYREGEARALLDALDGR